MINTLGLQEAKLVLFPLNFKDIHWVLIVVEVERKEILCIDSMSLVTATQLEKISKELDPFLYKVYKHKVDAWK